MEPFDWWNTSGNDYGIFKQAIESDDKSNILFKGEVESANIKYEELTRILNQFSQEFNVGWRGEFYMIDVHYLSKQYRLTGGQISIIVKNAATEAAGRKGKSRKLTTNDLVKYCEIEAASMFGADTARIGFEA